MAEILVTITVYGCREEEVDCSEVEKYYGGLRLEQAKKLVSKLVESLEKGEIEGFTISKLFEPNPNAII